MPSTVYGTSTIVQTPDVATSIGQVHLEVCDDGRGLMSNGEEIGGQGVGLKNTRERLSQLYGEDHHFSLLPGANGGAVSTVVLPFKRSNDSNGKVR